MAGAPPEYYAGVKSAGPLASFNSASHWVQHPYRNTVALIGDAASATDPMWVQGLSIAVRDVRVLRGHLLSHGDWDEANHAYATEHDKYYTVSRTVESWLEQVMVQTGSESDSPRTKAFPLWKEDPSRRLGSTQIGPDHAIDETVSRRFFGEE